MLFGKLRDYIGKAKPPAQSARVETGHVLQLLTDPSGFTPPPANSARLTKLYRTSPWVRSIVGKVAAGVARQPWFLEDQDGERLNKHPFLDFLRAGSPKLRGRAALKMAQLHIDLAGEAFLAIGRNGSKPVQWAPIPPHWVTDLPQPGKDYYEIQPTGGNGYRFTIPAADVLAFRDADPLDPYERGAGVTEAAYTEIQTDEAAASFLYSFFKNRARPDIIVSGTVERPLAEADVPRLETSWLEKFRGDAKAGRPMFARHPLEVKEIGKGLRDNETTALREQQKATIIEIFGVPPEILGRLDNSNRATIDAADYLFGKHTLDPRLSFLLDVLEPWALAEFDLGDYSVKYESPVPEDGARRLDAMKAFPGAFTPNEKRDVAGLRPRKEPEFDQPDKPEPAAADPNKPDPNKPDPNKPDPNKPDPNAPNDKPPKGGKSVEAPAVERSAPPAVVDKSLTPADVVTVSEAHEDPQVRAEVSRVFDEIFAKLVQRYGSELLDRLAVDVQFDSTVRLANWLAEEVPALVGYIDATTKKELAAALVDGAAKGEKLAELLARVDAIFADAAETRAPILGDTLATKITGFASHDAAVQGGFAQKMWLSSQDQVVRSTHRSMNRQVVPTSEKFTSPRGGRALHPGAFKEAAEDINCRCAMRPVLPGEDTSKSADAAEAFAAMHDKEWAAISKKVTERARDVFAGQHHVIATALRRAMVGRA